MNFDQRIFSRNCSSVFSRMSTCQLRHHILPILPPYPKICSKVSSQPPSSIALHSFAHSSVVCQQIREMRHLIQVIIPENNSQRIYKSPQPTTLTIIKMQLEVVQPKFKQYLLEGFGDQALAKLGDPLQYLVAVSSSCLLNEVRYYQNDDERRSVLLGALQLVEETEPEFVLQLAVYLRRQLGVRTTSNFILAYAACSPKLRTHLPKYFNKATVLPSDLIEVCQFTQIVHLLLEGKTIDQIRTENEGDLFDVRRNIYMPNQLKKVLIPKILAFNQYQLGKYCSEAGRKLTLDKYISARKGLESRRYRKRKEREEKAKKEAAKLEGKAEEKKEEKIVKEETEANKVRRIKKIGRGRLAMKRHTKAKKLLDPATLKKKAIELTFLTMKDLIGLLHIKPTLLTSAILGTKYPATKELFEKKFGPEGFDETLAGKRMKLATPVTWETELSEKGNKVEVWSKLIQENKVPYLATLRNLRNMIKCNVPQPLITKVANFIQSPVQVEKNRTTPLQYYSAIDEIDKLLRQADKPKMEIEGEEKPAEEKPVLSEEAKASINILKPVLSNALQLSMQNVEVLKGVTYIFVDVSGSMRSPLSGGKSYGSVRDCYQLSIILGLMVKAKCEKCEYFIFSSPTSTNKCYIHMNPHITGDLVKDIQIVKGLAKTLGGGTDFPTEVVHHATDTITHIDNMIILSDMMISQSFSNGEGYIKAISEYTELLNPKLKVFSIDLRGYSESNDIRREFSEKNFIRIYGANTSILRFISEKEGAQIERVRTFHLTVE